MNCLLLSHHIHIVIGTKFSSVHITFLVCSSACCLRFEVLVAISYSMEQSPSLVYCLVHKSPLLVPVFSQISSVRTLPFDLRSILIWSSSTSLSPRCSLSFRIPTISLLLRMWHIPRQSYPPWFEHSTDMVRSTNCGFSHYVTFYCLPVCYPKFKYDMIYLLTVIELSPGGRSTVHIYTQTIHRTSQQFWNSAGPVPSWLILPWHLPYKRGKSTEKPQSG